LGELGHVTLTTHITRSKFNCINFESN